MRQVQQLGLFSQAAGGLLPLGDIHDHAAEMRGFDAGIVRCTGLQPDPADAVILPDNAELQRCVAGSERFPEARLHRFPVLGVDVAQQSLAIPTGQRLRVAEDLVVFAGPAGQVLRNIVVPIADLGRVEHEPEPLFRFAHGIRGAHGFLGALAHPHFEVAGGFL